MADQSDLALIQDEPTGLFEISSMAAVSAKLNVSLAILDLLTRECSFDDFVRGLLLAVMDGMKCEAGSVIEVDYNHSNLFFRAAVGTNSDKLADVRIPLGQGIVGHVCETRRPYLVDNAAENQMQLKSIAKSVGFDTRNLVAVPIMVRGKVFAVLELLNKVGDADFTNDDVELVGSFCEMAAKAVEIRLVSAWATHRAAVAERRPA